VEVLTVNPTVAKLIEEGKSGDLYQAMQEGSYWGMQTRNQALLALYMEGKITARDALFYSGNYTEMRQMLRRVNPADAERAAREQPGLGGARGDVPEAQRLAAEVAKSGPRVQQEEEGRRRRPRRQE
jgi:hypothetical protein